MQISPKATREIPENPFQGPNHIRKYINEFFFKSTKRNFKMKGGKVFLEKIYTRDTVSLETYLGNNLRWKHKRLLEIKTYISDVEMRLET